MAMWGRIILAPVFGAVGIYQLNNEMVGSSLGHVLLLCAGAVLIGGLLGKFLFYWAAEVLMLLKKSAGLQYDGEISGQRRL